MEKKEEFEFYTKNWYLIVKNLVGNSQTICW